MAARLECHCQWHWFEAWIEFGESSPKPFRLGKGISSARSDLRTPRNLFDIQMVRSASDVLVSSVVVLKGFADPPLSRACPLPHKWLAQERARRAAIGGRREDREEMTSQERKTRWHDLRQQRRERLLRDDGTPGHGVLCKLRNQCMSMLVDAVFVNECTQGSVIALCCSSRLLLGLNINKPRNHLAVISGPGCLWSLG